METAERELRYGNAGARLHQRRAGRPAARRRRRAGRRARRPVGAAQLRRTVARWLRRARICWSAARPRAGHPGRRGGGRRRRAARRPARRGGLPAPVMSAHQRAGRSGTALVAYRQLQLAMSEQLGSDPSPATQALYVSILRAESPRVRRPAPATGTGAARAATGWSAGSPSWPGCAGCGPARRPGDPALAVVTGEAGHRQERAGRPVRRRAAADRGAGGDRQLLRGGALAVPAAAGAGGAHGRPAQPPAEIARAGRLPARHAGPAGARADRHGGRAGLRRAPAPSWSTAGAWTRWPASSSGCARGSRCC